MNVLYTSNQFYAQNQQGLKKHGILPEQYNVLRILRGSQPKPLILLDISGRMLDRSSNATRLVEKLRLKNLVTRTTCKIDRRQVDIGITEEGISLLEKLDSEMKNMFDRFLHLSLEETQTLNHLLDKMRG